MAEAAKTEVLQLVPKLSELQLLEITDALGLKLSDKPKSDRKKALRNLLKRYVESSELEDSDDEGLAVFVKLVADMKELIKEDDNEDDKAKLEQEVKLKLDQLKSELAKELGGGTSEKSGGSKVNNLENSSKLVTVPEYQKLKLQRDFRIQNGTIGGENPLDYGNLCFQIKEGLASGYSEKEIISAVLKATKPGTELQIYLIRARDLTFEDFKVTLREYYKVRESHKIMDEMVATVQKPKQPLLKYVMKMCALRDEILDVMQGEECPQDSRLVQRRFVESLLSGIREPTIRLEMQSVLKQNVSDTLLFKEVNQIMTRVEENEKKLELEGKAIGVKAVEVQEGGKKGQRSKEDERRDSELAALTAQVQKLEALVRSTHVPPPSNPNPSPAVSTKEAMDQNKIDMLIAQVYQLQTEVQQYRNFSKNPFLAGGSAGVGSGVGAGLGTGGGAGGGAVNGGGQGFGGVNTGPRKFSFGFHKCDDCVIAKTQCNHCRKCGEEGHKKALCPN